MSQAKVDRYKQEKANRKKIMAVEKAKKIAALACMWVVLVAIVGWAGYTGYKYYDSKRPTKTIYCQTDALSEYLGGLSSKK